MKPIKITAELNITPEQFKEWCEGELQPTETMWKVYVEKMLWSRFGVTRDYGDYKDFLNKTIEVKGEFAGEPVLKITTKEME